VYIVFARRWSSVVSIVTRLQTRQSEVQLPLGAKLFSLLQNVLPSLPFDGYRGPFTGVKRSVFEGRHSPQSSDEIKNEWIYTSTPPICFHGVDRENFTFSISITYVCFNEETWKHNSIKLHLS
jgi:hypothetical protein